MGSIYQDLNPFKTSEWVIGPKVIKDLAENPFNNDILVYREWHDLMRDHMLSTNHGYGRILYEIEREALPLTLERIQAQPYLPGMTADLNWITSNVDIYEQACDKKYAPQPQVPRGRSGIKRPRTLASALGAK